MRYQPSSYGFTLIELLVVISIVALLAAILFPVFARAREKAHQSTCTSNQRQLAAALQMYTQDHEEQLPSISTMWKDVNVDAGILVCPTLGSDTPNGYLYNIDLDNASLGIIADPISTMMTIDGNTSAQPGKIPNIAYFAEQFDPRHTNKEIASFLDGHVAMGTKDTITIKGGLYPFNTSFIGSVGYYNWTNPLCVVIDSSKPALSKPATDYAAARGGSYASPDSNRITSFPAGMLSAVGSSGYVLFNWNTATLGASSTLLAQRLNIPASGPIAIPSYTVGGNDAMAADGHVRGSCRYIVDGTEENTGGYGNIGSRNAANKALVFTIKDANIHYLTLDSNNYQGNQCPRGQFIVTSPVNNAQQSMIDFNATTDPTSNTGNRIFQFRMQFNPTDNPTGGTVLVRFGNNCNLKGLWFD